MLNDIWRTKLKMVYPIIQAPMAGVTTPDFVATFAEAGVLGSIGAGYLSAEETREFIREVKQQTKKAFAVNLFVPERIEVSEEQLDRADEALQPIRKKLGIPPKEKSFSRVEFDEQIQVIIDEQVKVCSFTFGVPEIEYIERLKTHNIFLIGTATSLAEAKKVEEAGLDAVVLQGREAGGHRGSFIEPFKFIPLDKLLLSAVGNIKIPIIAAGGIATSERKLELLNAGVSAVQIGTAFLLAEESGANEPYKKAIAEAPSNSTVITTSFSGRPARGIQNSFIKEMKGKTIAPYPYQNDLTKEIRKVAGVQRDAEYLSLWAGESVHLTKGGTVREIIQTFV